MIKIAITGGIGSGKSYVSRLLRDRGIPVYDADAEAKRLTCSDEGIRRALTALLGKEAYAGGTLNKPLLASYLFSSPACAVRVNAIIHPRVREDFARWARRQSEHAPVAGIESAILYEAGFEDTVDAVVAVCAPRETRLRRVVARDGVTRAQAEARMAAQMDDEEKCRRADYLVLNDGIRPLAPQLDDIIRQLLPP